MKSLFLALMLLAGNSYAAVTQYVSSLDFWGTDAGTIEGNNNVTLTASVNPISVNCAYITVSNDLAEITVLPILRNADFYNLTSNATTKSAITQVGNQFIIYGGYPGFYGNRTYTASVIYTSGEEAPTPTPTFTVTPSATRTVTPSATRTVTRTVTKTVTPSATRTVTRTVTPTITPTITATWSASPTYTITRTRTVTFTKTATRTVTPTATITPTATPTFTRTVTPTFTETP